MKKIDPVAWQYRAKVIGGTVTTEWRACCFSEYTWHKQGKYNEVVHYEVRQLYTREAIEAAVEAVKQECIEIATAWQDKYVVEDNAYLRVGQEIDESVDPAAIINQLTGE